MKECICGRTYTAEEWAQLRFACFWEFDEEEVLEHRHCHCKSTIVIVRWAADPERERISWGGRVMETYEVKRQLRESW